jgi:hypothetical protein
MMHIGNTTCAIGGTAAEMDVISKNMSMCSSVDHATVTALHAITCTGTHATPVTPHTTKWSNTTTALPTVQPAITSQAAGTTASTSSHQPTEPVGLVTLTVDFV